MENINDYKVGTVIFHASLGMGVIEKILKKPKTSLRINCGQSYPEKYRCKFFLTSCSNNAYHGKIEYKNFSENMIASMIENYYILCTQMWKLCESDDRNEKLKYFYTNAKGDFINVNGKY